MSSARRRMADQLRLAEAISAQEASLLLGSNGTPPGDGDGDRGTVEEGEVQGLTRGASARGSEGGSSRRSSTVYSALDGRSRRDSFASASASSAGVPVGIFPPAPITPTDAGQVPSLKLHSGSPPKPTPKSRRVDGSGGATGSRSGRSTGKASAKAKASLAPYLPVRGVKELLL